MNDASKRISFDQRIYELMTAHPYVPFDGIGLSRVGGAYGWRTRISVARKRLEREGKGTIVWQPRRLENGSIRSLYTFVPATGVR